MRLERGGQASGAERVEKIREETLTFNEENFDYKPETSGYVQTEYGRVMLDKHQMLRGHWKPFLSTQMQEGKVGWGQIIFEGKDNTGVRLDGPGAGFTDCIGPYEVVNLKIEIKGRNGEIYQTSEKLARPAGSAKIENEPFVTQEQLDSHLKALGSIGPK